MKEYEEYMMVQQEMTPMLEEEEKEIEIVEIGPAVPPPETPAHIPYKEYKKMLLESTRAEIEVSLTFSSFVTTS